MQLSVSVPSADSSLAAFPSVLPGADGRLGLGGAPSELSGAPRGGAGAKPGKFADLFPDLASFGPSPSNDGTSPPIVVVGGTDGVTPAVAGRNSVVVAPGLVLDSAQVVMPGTSAATAGEPLPVGGVERSAPFRAVDANAMGWRLPERPAAPENIVPPESPSESDAGTFTPVSVEKPAASKKISPAPGRLRTQPDDAPSAATPMSLDAAVIIPLSPEPESALPLATATPDCGQQEPAGARPSVSLTPAVAELPRSAESVADPVAIGSTPDSARRSPLTNGGTVAGSRQVAAAPSALRRPAPSLDTTDLVERTSPVDGVTPPPAAGLGPVATPSPTRFRSAPAGLGPVERPGLGERGGEPAPMPEVEWSVPVAPRPETVGAQPGELPRPGEFFVRPTAGEVPVPRVEENVPVGPPEKRAAGLSLVTDVLIPESGVAAGGQVGPEPWAPVVPPPVGVPFRRGPYRENIAVRADRNFDGPILSEKVEPKNFLSSMGEEVAEVLDELGTAVAQVMPDMLELRPKYRPASGQLPAVAALPDLVGPGAGVGAAASAVPAGPVAAHYAVEAALAAAGRFSGGDRQAVNLHFSVGGSELAVRVEMRAGEVRATFQTDSSELRDALAVQWQVMTADPASRSFRLAPPVITGNVPDGSASSAFADGGAAHQGEAGQRRGAGEVFGSVLPSRRPPAPAAGDVPLTASGLPGRMITALHLQTLA